MKSPSIDKISGTDSRITNGKRENGRPRAAVTLSDRIEDRDQELSLFTKSVRGAVEAYKQAGVPITVWEDDQVKIVLPEDIPDHLDD